MMYRASGLAVTLFTGAVIISASGLVAAQPVSEPMNEHPNPYRTINDFFPLPDGREWGATSAVDIDPDGTSIWVAERCSSNSCATSNADPVIKYDQDGNILTSFGGGMIIWPHGIDVDDQGNVWIADARAASMASKIISLSTPFSFETASATIKISLLIA